MEPNKPAAEAALIQLDSGYAPTRPSSNTRFESREQGAKSLSRLRLVNAQATQQNFDDSSFGNGAVGWLVQQTFNLHGKVSIMLCDRPD
jgi:hypothetical protein